MKALVTGASSGIGYDISKYLDSKGYEIIAVARNETRLNKLKSELKKKSQIIIMDLSKPENCKKLYSQLKTQDIDILINNAGFGLIGQFYKTDLDREVKMINTNIVAVHILMKLFLRDMIKKDRGYILNVGSIAGFMPGPLMATYYSTKSYVVKLTQSVHKELSKKKSNVSISVLCPGPVDTMFNDVANVRFALSSLKSEYVAKYAIDNMFKRKLVILPGFRIKFIKIFSKLFADSISAETIYHTQRLKQSKK